MRLIARSIKRENQVCTIMGAGGLIYRIVGNQYDTQYSNHPIVMHGFISQANDNKVAR